METKKLKGICSKCSHFETCKTPCYPVEKYISQNTVNLGERRAVKKSGQVIHFIDGLKRERNQSSLLAHFDDPGREDNREELFSTSAKQAFSGFDPKLQKTGVFVDRWCGYSFDAISAKYSLSYASARKTYSQAKARLMEIVKIMDSGKPQKLDPWQKKVQERSGILPKGQRWFLMSKVFGLLPVEIAKMEGLKSSTPVYKAIQYVSDRIKSGELILFKPTEKGKAEAKARLEAARKRDKNYRARNIEKIRARDQERYKTDSRS